MEGQAAQNVNRPPGVSGAEDRATRSHAECDWLGRALDCVRASGGPGLSKGSLQAMRSSGALYKGSGFRKRRYLLYRVLPECSRPAGRYRI